MTDTEEHKYEYCNYGTEKELLDCEVSYLVAGDAFTLTYATIELKDEIYYYCRYDSKGIHSRQAVGNKIVWSDEIYDKKNPYQCRAFDILDEVKKETSWDMSASQMAVDEDGDSIWWRGDY